jgi:hypothetical protein
MAAQAWKIAGEFRPDRTVIGTRASTQPLARNLPHFQADENIHHKEDVMRAFIGMGVLALGIAACTGTTTLPGDQRPSDPDQGAIPEMALPDYTPPPQRDEIPQRADPFDTGGGGEPGSQGGGGGGGGDVGGGGAGGEGGSGGAPPTCDQPVTLCHFPPGNPDGAHTLTVGAPAVMAHVEHHGDILGACGEPSEVPTEFYATCTEPTFEVVCHIPPGNGGNQHTLTVGEAAMNAHLAHGDMLGPCE